MYANKDFNWKLNICINKEPYLEYHNTRIMCKITEHM